MSDQTNEWGKRLEDLYSRCMRLPRDQREAFILANAADDPELQKQLRHLIQLPLTTENTTPATITTAPTVTTAPGIASGDAMSGMFGTSDRFELQKDTVFGHCRIVNGHDSGAMGSVYLAQDIENHDRLVALKVLRPHLLSPGSQQRFSDETSALSRLVHPNIAAMYYWGIQKWKEVDRPFLVMEFVNGLPLDKYFAQTKLTTAQILDTLQKICRAVDYGHIKGVYHRDLKPANILTTREGEPKIVDFSISFIVSTDSAPGRQTTTKDNAGTLPYMAPEVASGELYSPDPRTDVYSLGIIAFEAFAKRRPMVVLPSGEMESIESQQPSAIVRQRIAECERESLRHANPRVSRDLELVIAKALRRDITKRYADAREFAEDLRHLIDRKPIRARPVSWIYNAWMFASRNRFAVTAAVLVFAAVLTTAIVASLAELRVRVALAESQRANAASHFRAAQLAEQQGKWSIAAQEYHDTQVGGASDQLDQVALLTGQLKALAREGDTAQADALIAHVNQMFPAVARSPQFLLSQGLYYWSADQKQSIATINLALTSADKLDPGDRAFAEALITDDVHVAAAKFRESLAHNSFNNDALGMLVICDMALGDAHQAEMDAQVMQRLYPGDPAGSVLASVGAAFQGRRDAALSYLNSHSSGIPPAMLSTFTELAAFIAQIHSYDDVRSISPMAKFRLVTSIGTHLSAFAGSEAFPSVTRVPIPLTFSRAATNLGPDTLIHILTDSDSLLELGANLPSGNGEFAQGQLAFRRGKMAEADQHLRVVFMAPALVDCRRAAAFQLLSVHRADFINRHVSETQTIPVLTADINRLISLGGILPEKFPEEYLAANLGYAYKLFPQVRTLMLGSLSRDPEKATSLYYLALADENLNQQGLAAELFVQALAKGLTGDDLFAAQEPLQRLKAARATTESAIITK